MKKRTDFVTNSSSSSFICCFARVADKNKAQAILDKHKGKIEIYSAEEVLSELGGSRWSKWLEYDWAGVDVTPDEKYIRQHMDDNFIVITDSEEIFEDEDGYTDYYVEYSDFDTEAIDDITEENGFAEIECQYGAGRDG